MHDVCAVFKKTKKVEQMISLHHTSILKIKNNKNKIQTLTMEGGKANRSFHRRAADEGAEGRIGSRRLGFTVFVNYVSKRIHYRTLKEAFEGYGSVRDVFVAYNSLRRRGSSSTFAFVRFKSLDEAKNAVKEGNERLLDGFRIKVSLEKELVESRPGPKESKKGSRDNTWSYRDDRSYRDVLIGESLRNGISEARLEGVAAEKNVMVVDFTDIRKSSDGRRDGSRSHAVEIESSEVNWRALSLVGRIKAMYNPELIEQALVSEGYQVKVSQWQDLLVVLQFSSRESFNQVWCMREEMMQMWFDDLERLVGFEGKRRVKVWVRMLDVPLSVWCPSFFTNIGRKWGSVVRIDKDTLERNRFDEAKLLVEVQHASDIPDRVSILVRNQLREVKISTEVFEEDRIFLDGRSPFDDVQAAVESQESGEEHRLQGVFNDVWIEDALQRSPNDDCAQASAPQVVHAESARAKSSSNNLFDVPLLSGEGSFGPSGLGRFEMGSSGRDVSPSISNGSRLQDVPIGIISEVENGLGCFLAFDNGGKSGVPPSATPRFHLNPIEATPKRQDNCDRSGKGRKGKKGRRKTRPMEQRGVDCDLEPADGYSTRETNLKEVVQEAEATLEVSSALGVVFGASRDELVERFVLLEGAESELR
ncbi:hypothetical protein HRI_004592300 [Hibiscus trionum]|uniref:RRM domain-containing protein n=1 Tax=Hibiscus trionum TaxID=183268 RepID=A0A9W7J5Z6_HIBTR|nr:hypothetical protein HRI_004592300 [Hibiscus trionum]